MHGCNIPHVIFLHERQHRITHRLDLKKLWEVTVQPPAQSRGSSVFRPGSSGLCPILPSKSPGSETPQFPGQSLILHGCPQGQNIFLYSESDTPLFQLMIIGSRYPIMQVTIELGPLFLVISS